ncbi:MAG: GIY-YIG nuclease family protein [Crocinitomicaceae bacterium]
MFYIYIIYSQSSDVYYIGFSSYPNERLKQHNHNDGTTYTGKHSDWVFKAVFEVSPSRAETMKLEKFIKKQKSRAFIEKLIDPKFKLNGQLAQLKRVSYIQAKRQ